MTYSIEQMAQLAKKFTKMNWSPEMVTTLGQADKPKFLAIEEILKGKSIKEAIKLGSEVRVFEEDTSHLKFLITVQLGATSRSVTIADSGDVFTVFLDSDFKNWSTNKPGEDTSGAIILIYEMKKDGTFSNLFNSFDTGLRNLVWQQAEIVMFCQTHLHLLRQDGYATFFLFEVEGQLFVACVSVLGGELLAFVYRFELDFVWYSKYRHRLVIPQRTA